LEYLLNNMVGRACFWCTEYFNGIPLHAPIRKDSKGNFICSEVVFCSFSCAKGHVLREMRPSNDGYTRVSLLMELAASHGKHSVPTAPPRHALQKFGGPMTLEQFRNTEAPIVNETWPMQPVKNCMTSRMMDGQREKPPPQPQHEAPGLVLRRERPRKRAKTITFWFSK